MTSEEQQQMNELRWQISQLQQERANKLLEETKEEASGAGQGIGCLVLVVILYILYRAC